MLVYVLTTTCHYEEEPHTVTTISYIASTTDKMYAYIENELVHLGYTKQDREPIMKAFKQKSCYNIEGDDWCIELCAVDAKYDKY